MIKQDIVLTTADFLFFKDSGVMHAEASALRGAAGLEEISILSLHTGKLAWFVLNYVARDEEGEIIGWEYTPKMPSYCPRVELVAIYND